MNNVRNTLLSKRLFIFDMDGTIYLGSRPFPFAVNFINHLREWGYDVMFFTNNASHSSTFYYTKLASLGYSPTQTEIMTAGDVTAEFLLRHRRGKSVYVVGTSELRRDWRGRGIRLVSDEDAGEGRSADIVVSSFDTELTYSKLSEATRMIRNGAEYLSTHPDFNCPIDGGFIPDSGAIAALITASTGVKPRYFGKPYGETIEMIKEVTGYASRDICIFGDRLYTDIALGKQNGITSVLVLTGETKAEDLEKTAPADYPDIVLPSLLEADKLMIGE